MSLIRVVMRGYFYRGLDKAIAYHYNVSKHLLTKGDT